MQMVSSPCNHKLLFDWQDIDFKVFPNFGMGSQMGLDRSKVFVIEQDSLGGGQLLPELLEIGPGFSIISGEIGLAGGQDVGGDVP